MKEIEVLTSLENPTIKQKLKMRNLERQLVLMDSNHPEVWCELQKAKITNLGACMFCSFGHMLECHHPYDCNSEYCNHYANGGDDW